MDVIVSDAVNDTSRVFVSTILFDAAITVIIVDKIIIGWVVGF